MILPFSKSSSNEALHVSSICSEEANYFSSAYPVEVDHGTITEIVDEL